MSLKAFHVIFVTISVLLCLGFGAWCLGSDYARGRIAYTLAGYVSFALAIGLVIYGSLFLKKLKDIQ
jgi:hypothetical protein